MGVLSLSNISVLQGCPQGPIDVLVVSACHRETVAESRHFWIEKVIAVPETRWSVIDLVPAFCSILESRRLSGLK